MDLTETIKQLRNEHERLVSVIEQLEALQHSDGTEPPRSRRGRRSMSEAERREVSARMKHYWASRRKAKGKE